MGPHALDYIKESGERSPIERRPYLCYNTLTMKTIDTAGLAPAVTEKFLPFAGEVLAAHEENIHSLHVVGSAVLPDYDEKLSDVNSVVVLRNMDLEFISFLAPLGKKYGKKRIAAPLVMTPEYIRRSQDAFPVEFLDFKLIHRTLYGEDVFKDLAIEKQPLRLQVEREIKVKLIGLRQGHISSLGKHEHLSSVLVKSFTGSLPLFRAILSLLGKEPPLGRMDAIAAFGRSSNIDVAVFEKMLSLKTGRIRLSGRDLPVLFDQYYHTLEAVEKVIDELPA